MRSTSALSGTVPRYHPLTCSLSCRLRESTSSSAGSCQSVRVQTGRYRAAGRPCFFPQQVLVGGSVRPLAVSTVYRACNSLTDDGVWAGVAPSENTLAALASRLADRKHFANPLPY